MMSLYTSSWKFSISKHFLFFSQCQTVIAFKQFNLLSENQFKSFKPRKKFTKIKTFFFNIQRVPSNTFLQQVAFKSRPLVYLSYPSTFFGLAIPSFSRPTHNWPASSHLPKLFFPRSAQQQQQGKHQTICKGHLPTNNFQQLFAKGIY